MLPTASSLERASKCLGSTVLPRVDASTDAAERGLAIHAFLARVAEVGREDALEEVPEEYRGACAVIDLDVLPTSALEVVSELALAWDADTGIARELGRNIGRNYPPVGPREFVGTADIVTISRDELLVADFKTGHGYLAPAREHAQLRFLGLAAARRFGRTHLRAALIRIAEDGTPFFDSADFDELDLDSIEAELEDLAGRIEATRDLLSLGEPPPVMTGPHCRRCPSLVYCPAQALLIRRMATAPEEVGEDILSELTSSQAAAAWTRLKTAEEVIRRAREAMYAFAREYRIELPNGLVLGEVETKRRIIEGRAAYSVLEHLHGKTVAEAAVELEASQASIERALRVVADETGSKLAKLKRDVMRELEQAGAISFRTSRSVREHLPKQSAEESIGAAAHQTGTSASCAPE